MTDLQIKSDRNPNKHGRPWKKSMASSRCAGSYPAFSGFPSIVTPTLQIYKKNIITSKKNTKKMKEDIIILSNKGLTVEEIAEELGCSEGYVVFVLVHRR